MKLKVLIRLFRYGLLGASGCGKTTLLSCIVGQKKLHEGVITVLGTDITRNPGVIGPRIGYMPQVNILYFVDYSSES